MSASVRGMPVPVGDVNGLRERSSEVRIRGAAIPDIETGIDVEMHEIGQTADVLSAGCAAALEVAEGIEVDRIGTFGFEIGIEKGGVTDFIERVAGDVLRPVPVEVLQGQLIWILGPAGDATQFGILRPQIGFDQFGCGDETQNGNIAVSEFTIITIITCRLSQCRSFTKQTGTDQRATCEHAAFQKRSPARLTLIYLF